MPKGKSYFKKKGKPTKSMKNVRQIVSKVLNAKAEHKWLSVGYNVTALVGGTALITDLTSIAQSASENNRTGVQIQPTSGVMRFAAFASAAVNTLVRLVIFRWHPDNSTGNPTWLQIMGPGAVIATPDFYSNPNPNNKSQYSILLDHSFRCSSGSGLAAPLLIRRFSPGKSKISYNTGAAVTTGENHLYAAFMSDAAAVISGNFIIKYTDI